jgi:hypothetical protein
MTSSAELSSIESAGILASSKELINQAAEQLNLFSVLRTIPVGIPSIMSGRSPIEIPAGAPLLVDIKSPLAVAMLVLVILLVGLCIGCFYYYMVVQAAFQGKINLREVIRRWPKGTLQVFSLSLALLILFIAITIPASCAISVVALFGLPLGQLAIFLYIGLILWLAFPLVFSAHGIFVNHYNALLSVQRSMLMTRATLPTTALFILLVFLVSEGLNYLWRVPPENSWLTLVGVGGHAFITSALLAASFVYYRDADRWTQVALKLINSNREKQARGM